MYLTILL